MNLSVCISVYIVGYLVFPFFYSLVDGWPFVSPRMTGSDSTFALLLCAVWPLAALVWLMGVWWCGVSRLGTLTRRLCGRLMKAFNHAAKRYEQEVK